MSGSLPRPATPGTVCPLGTQNDHFRTASIAAVADLATAHQADHALHPVPRMTTLRTQGSGSLRSSVVPLDTQAVLPQEVPVLASLSNFPVHNDAHAAVPLRL